MFDISDRYEQIMLYRYFLNDIKHIERHIKTKNKFSKVHGGKLETIANCISPNFKYHSIHESGYSKQSAVITSLLVYLETIDVALDSEKLYNEDIEKIRIALKGIKRSDTLLDDIIDDIRDTVMYYGHFGNNILEDKFHSVFSISFVNRDRIKELSKKHQNIVKVLIMFFKTYKKIKNIKGELIELLEYVETYFPESEEEMEVIEDEK